MFVGISSHSTRSLLPLACNVETFCSPFACVAHTGRLITGRSKQRTSRLICARWLSSNRPHNNVDISTPETIVDNTTPSSRPWHIPPPSSPAAFADPLERLKHPARGGQNLGGRYERLERALRGKEGYEREIEEYEKSEKGNPVGSTSGAVGSGGPMVLDRPKRRRKIPLVFHGFTIPDAPKPPESDECCMSGCVVCVHDLYAEALEAYENALDSIRSALHGKGVAECTWPRELRADPQERGDSIEGDDRRKVDLTGKDLVRAKQASLSAFEKLELQLSAKKHTQEIDQSGGIAMNGSGKGNVRGAGKVAVRPTPGTKIDIGDVIKALSWVIFSRR